MFGTILLSSLLLVQVPCSEAKALPRGFAIFLEKMGILDQYLDSTMSGQKPAISTTQNDETTRFLTLGDTPEHSSGLNTTKLNNTPYMPEDVFCDLRPTAVRIPKHPGVRSFPDYVMLHRCTGSCLYTQDTQHCAVTHQDEITVNIFELLGNIRSEKTIKLYNHTACACDCITKSSDCDPVKQVFDEGSCSCKCKSDGSECNSANQRWIQATCECECSFAPLHCNHNKEWDPKNCGCHCKKSLQVSCEAQNRKIDPDTCECEDPNVIADFFIHS